ncbi:hypothetical protein VNO77_33907 [Canavalia gladiata]|uniref:Uncharacterized protein n=1 Tax=Canavalia gladiata TaxID=3824 RepID=A0AAN9Q190_CANGL
MREAAGSSLESCTQQIPFKFSHMGLQSDQALHLGLASFCLGRFLNTSIKGSTKGDAGDWQSAHHIWGFELLMEVLGAAAVKSLLVEGGPMSTEVMT